VADSSYATDDGYAYDDASIMGANGWVTSAYAHAVTVSIAGGN
jgi:beta-N-acetylglucosaminidase